MNELRFRKLVLFVGLYCCAIAIPAFVVRFGTEPLVQRFGGDWWLAPFVLLGVLLALTPIIYLMLVRKLENRMFADERRYHQTLISTSENLAQIKDVPQLCNHIVDTAIRTLELTHASIFLHDPADDVYLVRAANPNNLFEDNFRIEAGNPMIAVLKKEQAILKVFELNKKAGQAEPEWKARYTEAYDWMRKLEVKLVIPSFVGGELLGFLAIGAKRDAHWFTAHDIAILMGLMHLSALAIENAQALSQLRESEAHIIQSEKLASIGQLASGMAHEIHNPLTIISAEAQLYLERCKGKDEEVDKVMQGVIDECRRAADITRRILRFAKPSASADLEPMDLRRTIEESVTMAGYQVRLDTIEHNITLPENLPRIFGNHNQLQEVVLNLIINACQAMGKGGKLWLNAQANGTSVILKVRDSGPGIPREKLNKIFEPFYTTKHTGTGLGLFVTQRIIKAHHGTIDVESEEGIGTCFTIRLPIANEVETPVHQVN